MVAAVVHASVVAIVIGGVIGAVLCEGRRAAGSNCEGARTFSGHGTEDLTGKTEAAIEADINYFGPTFLKGSPG